MATMIPEVPDTSAILLPERLLYDALRSQLDKRFTVFHSYPWLRRWRGDQDRPLQEGETDFLVLHPELGALVIEVKGGDVECDQRGAWSRRTSAGSKPIQNPFLQARKNMHALLELVDNRGRGEVRRGDLSYGYAVAFTQCDYRGQLPADADPHIVITSRHLDDVSAAVGRAFTLGRPDEPDRRTRVG